MCYNKTCQYSYCTASLSWHGNILHDKSEGSAARQRGLLRSCTQILKTWKVSKVYKGKISLQFHPLISLQYIQDIHWHVDRHVVFRNIKNYSVTETCILKLNPTTGQGMPDRTQAFLLLQPWLGLEKAHDGLHAFIWKPALHQPFHFLIIDCMKAVPLCSPNQLLR